jgi:hypothetical protein
MLAHKTCALAAALAVAIMAGVAPALAEVNVREPNPAAWLRQVYYLYHRAENSETLETQADTKLIVARASKSLAALFKKEDDCTAKSGICAIDWDFVVDGQDWKLSNVKVGTAVVAGDKATVTVSFKNFDVACVNVYYFVREDGRWKVDDIETKSGSEAPVRIAKLLGDYDYTQ